jgi:hypothetical protein
LVAFPLGLYYNKYKVNVRLFKEVLKMDIASISNSVSAQNVNNDVQVAMLSKSLDTMEDLGDGITKMMEASVTPYLGQNIDYSV